MSTRSTLHSSTGEFPDEAYKEEHELAYDELKKAAGQNEVDPDETELN